MKKIQFLVFSSVSVHTVNRSLMFEIYPKFTISFSNSYIFGSPDLKMPFRSIVTYIYIKIIDKFL